MIRSLLGLLRLGLSTRFRVNGAYWKWRKETAFGDADMKWGASAPTEAERRRAMLEYAAWAQRMRRHLKP